jgi:thiol-disulfide isomerase/thioredoxin
MELLLFWLALQADLFSPHGEKAVVLIFTRTDCPISNRYAPEIQRLYRKYSAEGVDFRLVYPERDLSAEAMERHRREYGYSMPALQDAAHQYVARAQARTTPEAAVFAGGKLVYHGRIDDRYIDLTRAKQQPERHDLEEALAAVVAGKSPPARETSAIGCAIEAVR